MSAARFLIFGGVGCAAVMMVVGVGVQVVDKHGGVEQFAASAEELRQNMRDSLLPDVGLSMNDLFKDPVVEKAWAQARASAQLNPEDQIAAIEGLMSAVRKPMVAAIEREHCDQTGMASLSGEDLTRAEQRCEAARSLGSIDYAAYANGGMMNEPDSAEVQELMRLSREDPAAFQRKLLEMTYKGALDPEL